MFVEAIIDENIDFEKGDLIWGNVRSYNQDFMNDEEMFDLECDYDNNGDIIDARYINKPIRFKLKKGSIKAVFCGCNNRATREIQGEYLCDECEYEEGEDHSYICNTPFEWGD